jgi:hypothetical protein
MSGAMPTDIRRFWKYSGVREQVVDERNLKIPSEL